MPTQSINFSGVTLIRFNGADINKLQRAGTRWWERVWVPSTYQTQVNYGYWVDPGPYWEWVYTGQYYVGSGRWNVGGNANPNLPMWPDGSPESFYSGHGGYNWVQIGTYTNGDGYHYWLFDAYQHTGYDQYVDPGPYWQDNWVTVTNDNSYWAYYY
ncbi:MAG: hypothetical protein ACKOQV_04135 [Betaproteobacteria bacterium]